MNKMMRDLLTELRVHFSDYRHMDRSEFDRTLVMEENCNPLTTL